jgi:hypothetical protein
MAYDYLGLVNDVNRRLNEVELTAANFATTTGYYSFAKDAVNAAIRHIQQEEYGWPWNHVEETEVLVPGTVRYGFPYDSKIVDMNTFRIKRDDALNTTTKKLRVISYEEYLTKYADQEYNSNTNIRTVPTHVARTPSREFMLYPSPDKAYELVYEYYRTGFDLENATDVCNLPEQYRYVIVDGAMHYVYQFRGDTQASQLTMQKFEQGIKYLRSLHINRTDYLGDTRVGF